MKKEIKLIALSAILTCAFAVKAADLLLFVDKGSDHVFLGCFSCDQYDRSSIWNTYGEYGSQYSQKSIWNEYGDFGSEYSDYSPWNKYSSKLPPVLVDRTGKFYGYFTCNRYKDKRVSAKLMDFLCDNLEKIREDPGRFHEKYFE